MMAIYTFQRRCPVKPYHADLAAFHEHTEIRHKLAGRSHGYAHHRALLEELLAAKQIFDNDALTAYVHQRVFGYPDWKLPDKESIEEKLCEFSQSIAR